ncbi:MAG: hypothetical protein M1832_000170 [Thelocarpon impressellum]|nr:MAG: hypothetical protein M1832_000170 [Thelocarpon impressellum]
MPPQPAPSSQPPAPAPTPAPAPAPALAPGIRALHTSFTAITIHTAKCDLCNARNKSVLQRCDDCGWSICALCVLERGTAGTGHVINEGDQGWTAARAETEGPGVRREVEGRTGRKARKGKAKAVEGAEREKENTAVEGGAAAGRGKTKASPGGDEASPVPASKRRRKTVRFEERPRSPDAAVDEDRGKQAPSPGSDHSNIGLLLQAASLEPDPVPERSTMVSSVAPAGFPSMTGGSESSDSTVEDSEANSGLISSISGRDVGSDSKMVIPKYETWHYESSAPDAQRPLSETRMASSTTPRAGSSARTGVAPRLRRLYEAAVEYRDVQGRRKRIGVAAGRSGK